MDAIILSVDNAPRDVDATVIVHHEMANVMIAEATILSVDNAPRDVGATVIVTLAETAVVSEETHSTAKK